MASSSSDEVDGADHLERRTGVAEDAQEAARGYLIALRNSNRPRNGLLVSRCWWVVGLCGGANRRSDVVRLCVVSPDRGPCLPLQSEWPERTAMTANRKQPTCLAALHQLHVDHSERQSALLDALQRGGTFDVQMVRLATGDYLINNEVLIERKTIGDFAMSLVDGRLFPQAARLACSHHRSLLLIEGPTPASMPDVHPHALEGALVSLAAMWRLPVLHSPDPDHSLRILQFLADQAGSRRSKSCAGTTGSRNDSHRNASTCSKDSLESAPRSRTECSASSARSNA